MSKHLLCETLVTARLLRPDQMAAVLDRCAFSEAYPQTVIAELGIATENQTTIILASALKLLHVDLTMMPRDTEALSLLDANYCRRQAVLPVALRDDGRTLWLAMADPTNQETIATAKDRTGKRIHPTVAEPRLLLRTIDTAYGLAQPPKPTPAPVSLDGEVFTAADLLRVQHLQASMQKTGDVLGALVTMLDEKGIVTANELHAQRKKPRVPSR